MRLIHLKNKHKGRKGVIIGGGPSLGELIDHDYPFHQLKDNYTIIGANIAFKYLHLDYLLFLDGWFWQSFHKSINELKDTIKLSQVGYENKYKPPVSEEIVTIPTKHVYFPLLEKDTIYCNNTGSGMLSLSSYLGFKELYLFGFDMKTQNNKKNFHEDYVNNGKTDRKNKQLKMHYENVKEIIKILESTYNKKIFSCSNISRLNNHIEYIDPWSLI